MVGVLALAQGDVLAQQATPADICQASTLKALGPHASTCNNTSRNPVFWVPPCGVTSPLASQAKNWGNAASITILHNRAPGRVLQLTGTVRDDIIIASPVSSEILAGGNGNNTYVVGGGTSTLLTDAQDRPFVASGSQEVDILNLDANGVDYIHIKLDGQLSPGTITTPTGDRTVQGSADLPANVKTVCPSLQVSGAVHASPLLATTALRPFGVLAPQPLSLAGAPPCPPALCGTSRSGVVPSYPGVPVLRNLDVSSTGADRLLLPAAAYLHQGQSLSGRREIPILVVAGITFAPSRLVSPAQLSQLLAQARGLRPWPASQAPLVYFQDHGLLVFSQNQQPLGSGGNPGRVIAQLLDASGLPQVLPGRMGLPPRQVNFVRFQASAPSS